MSTVSSISIKTKALFVVSFLVLASIATALCSYQIQISEMKKIQERMAKEIVFSQSDLIAFADVYYKAQTKLSDHMLLELVDDAKTLRSLAALKFDSGDLYSALDAALHARTNVMYAQNRLMCGQMVCY